GHRVTVLGQVDGIVAEPAADIENVAVNPAAGLPPDDTLAGRRVIPWWCGHRRDAFAQWSPPCTANRPPPTAPRPAAVSTDSPAPSRTRRGWTWRCAPRPRYAGWKIR